MKSETWKAAEQSTVEKVFLDKGDYMDIREEIRLEGKLEGIQKGIQQGIQQGIRKAALFVQPFLEQGTEKRHKSFMLP